ncbi:cardiolipin synthase [Aquimarina sp. AU474]|uniref:cardiolipin synthase n=1 Tax=Aquimarina sp. AU474 TaxID=2108529 RepID=UPI000D689B01|nr:cardiolipin synthase [Aquimarina sp. AU474]
MTSAIILSIYIIIGIIIVGRLLLYGMRPTKTLGWLLVIFTIPVGGILLYLLLGRNRRKNKLFKLQQTDEIISSLNNEKLLASPIKQKDYKEHIKVIKLIVQNSGFISSSGNRLKILKNGNATFTAIFESLKKAEKFIHLEYYIFEEGRLADNLFQLFEIKVKEGVEIRILYDGIGSRHLSNQYIQKLKNIGVEVCSFLPIRFGKFLSSLNYRNHRKIIVIDNKIAFTGGINVSDKYVTGDSYLGIWNDMHLQLEGPIIHSLQAIFIMDWNLINSTTPLLASEYFSPVIEMGDIAAQIVHSGPDEDFSATQQLYFSLINEAKDYVYITNPYIIPGEAILEALKVAALSGVDVRLLLSDKSDNFIVRWCVRSYFESLLQAGVKIYLFLDGFVHSKTIVVDDTICSIGTTNLDIRSFEQNYEVNVAIYDDDFSIALKNDFISDLKKGYQLNYQKFINRPLKEKLKEGIAKIFSPVL